MPRSRGAETGNRGNGDKGTRGQGELVSLEPRSEGRGAAGRRQPLDQRGRGAEELKRGNEETESKAHRAKSQEQRAGGGWERGGTECATPKRCPRDMIGDEGYFLYF